jgi:hypothetical protein
MAGAVAAIVWAIVPGQETIAPFAYHREREGEFQRAGAAGEAHLVYANSPGGAVATARRVARLGPGIDGAARAGGVAPEVVEGMVFLESGGLPDVIAGGDPKGAAGVAQILPETARGLLGLRVDLTASRRLTRQIAAARRRHDAAAVARLSRQRRRVDQRFDPARSLTAMGRYLALARPKFAGRPDFAVVSYHMGIENLADAVRAYAGPKEKRLAVHVIRERGLTYAQLYFDSGPFRHRTAYRKLQALGDDSSTYYWRVLAARDIMRLWRTDPARLRRVAALETAYGSAEGVIRPRSRRPAVRVPNDPAERHYVLDPPRAATLRPEALAVLYYIAQRVHRIARTAAPLRIGATAAPSFDLERRYASQRQAVAFQAMLDRLQALNVIAWERRPTVIHITASSRARKLEPLLHGAQVSDGS